MAPFTLTTQEAAELLGVAPSTIKRWADQGLLRVARTVGGHRRFLRGEVERLGAAAAPTAAEVDRWTELFVSGADLHVVVGALLVERGRLGAWWAVGELLGDVLTEVGDRWARGCLRVLDEHRISHRVERALALCAGHVAVPEVAPAALLVTAEGEEHTLGLSLAELCAREAGWRSWWGGRHTPFADVAALVASGEVSLVGESASLWSSDADRLRAEAEALADVARRARVALVLGGRGAWPEAPPDAHRLHGLRAFHDLLVGLRASG